MDKAQFKIEIANFMAEKKPFMLGQIAQAFECDELKVAKHLPDNMVSFASKDEFEYIWTELCTWAKCTTLVQHLGSVFEIYGALNVGSFGHGFYNLHGDNPLHGHLKVDDIEEIAFLSMPFMGMESHSVHFYNQDGEVKFSVYVGRENKVLIAEAKESFLTLQQKYAG